MNHLPTPSPKVIPRVRLSPSVKQRPIVPPETVKLIQVIPPIIMKPAPAAPSPRHKSTFLINKKKFRNNPDINPISGRSIKRGGYRYKQLVTVYGEPY